MRDDFIHDRAGGQPSLPDDEQRHPQNGVVEIRHVTGWAVLEQLLAVVGGEDDQRIFGSACLAERRKQNPDLLIKVLHFLSVTAANLFRRRAVGRLQGHAGRDGRVRRVA